jgi:hypothetical protein
LSTRYSFFRNAPAWALLLYALGMGALGGLLLWFGVDEQVSVLASIGVALIGTGAVSLLMAGFRGLLAILRRFRSVDRRRRRLPRRVLLGIAAALALPAALALHNYIVWRGIEKDCKTALRTRDLAEGLRAYRRGRQAMRQRLLIIPSSLFDLWGPNRCKSARARYPGVMTETSPTQAAASTPDAMEEAPTPPGGMTPEQNP